MPSHSLIETPLTTKKGFDYFPLSIPFINKHKLFNITEAYTSTLIPKKQYNIEDLRPYQNEGVTKILHTKRIGVFDQQRLGKTPMTLAALSQIENVHNVIIIAPKSTLYSWYEECKKWFTKDVMVATGDKAQRKRIYKANPKVLIMGYLTPMLDEGLIPSPFVIVVDESHRMRNFKGQNSKYSPKSIKAIMKLSITAEYKLALSGTPSANTYEDIYPTLHFLHPNLFTSYYKFRDYYFDVETKYINREDTIEVVTDFKPGRKEELQNFLDNTCLQRKRKDYLKWIPKVDRKTITVNLDKKEQKWYNEIAKTFECEELGIVCANQLSQMTALRTLTAKSNEKLQWIMSYLEDYPDESVLILSEFSTYLTILQKLIPNSRLLIGSVSDKERKTIENDFNNKKFNVLLGNITVCKEGMKLEACSTIIFIDPSLTYIDNEQVEDRLLPTTKEVAINKNKQQIIHLVVKDTIDEYIQVMLDNKKTKVQIINNFKNTLG